MGEGLDTMSKNSCCYSFFYFSLSSTPLQIVKRWSYSTIVDYIFDNHIVGFHYIRVDLLDGTIRITEV